MTANLDKISNLIQWQLDRGLTYAGVPQHSTEEYSFVFLVESADFNNPTAIEMLHKIIKALKIPENKHLITANGQLDGDQVGYIRNAIAFGSIANLPSTNHLVLLPSLSEMIENPELKIGAWEKLKSLSF